MYLTVQHVLSSRGKSGVNAVLYSHREGGLPAEFWERPDVEFVATQAPGVRTAVRVEVAPGGNRVLSYLDIVAQDGTSTCVIAEALAAGRVGAHPAKAFVVTHGGVVVRFSDEGAAADSVDEYETLCAAARDLYEHSAPPSWAALDPLTIVLEHGEDTWSFQLASADTSRVRPLLDEGAAIARVSIPFEVADEFREIHGALYPHAVEWVTGLTREQLLSLGGVRILDAEKVVWEWPKR